MQFTLREMTARMMNRRLAAIWLAASLVATMSGPFGTLAMPLLPRAAYWVFAMGLAVSLSGGLIYAAYALLPFRWMVLRGLAGALGFSALYAVIMPLAASLAFTGDGFPGFLQMFLYAAPIAVAITLIVALFMDDGDAEVAAAAPSPATPSSTTVPRLFNRLKPSLGRTLIRLSMQDHYVEVVTEQGTQLLLMRFADALEEVEGVPGWRIHRSHWVAEAGLADLNRRDGRWVVETRDGASLPVSRTYLPELREAGVLARFT